MIIKSYSLNTVQFNQDSERPEVVIITAEDSQLWVRGQVGRFNFYTKEGFINLPNGKTKEVKQFKAILNTFFKLDDMFGYTITGIENAQKVASNMIKQDKKQRQRELLKADQTKFDLLVSKINNESNFVKTFENKSEEELTQLAENTFKYNKSLVSEVVTLILNKLNNKKVVTVEEVAEQIQVTEESITVYQVGHRTFNTKEDAITYCNQSDFDPDIMIEEVNASSQVSEVTNNKDINNNESEVFYLYKNTFNTYNEAYNHALRNLIPVTMIISSKHPTLTNERLQQLEHEYVFSKGSMSITDLTEYYEYISSLPITSDREDRYYKLRDYIKRYEYKQRQIIERKQLQTKQLEELVNMFEDLYSIGVKKEENKYMVSYYLNGEKIYSWFSGITIEKQHSELLEVHNKYFRGMAS